MDIFQTIANELKIRKDQVEKTVALIDEGNTIPFISRYRKEVTGNLGDDSLRALDQLLGRLRSLEKRKDEVVRLISEQGKLSQDLEDQIRQATSLQEVEDFYLPYRPKRRTRALIAREKGAEPLAQALLDLHSLVDLQALAQDLVAANEEVVDIQEALALAQDIVAEIAAEDMAVRQIVRNDFQRATLVAQGKEEEDPQGTYKIYYNFQSKVKDLKPYQVLALFRGEKEGVLKIGFDLRDEFNVFKISRIFSKDESYEGQEILVAALEDSYKRLILPSMETEIRNELKTMADRESIQVFQSNLKPYLMQAPIKDTVVLGMDPGFRTGCKLAVVSAYGDYLDHGTIFPTKPRQDIQGSKKKMKEFIDRYQVRLIAIGNGTASRETEQFVVDLLKDLDRNHIFYTIVNEAGASIYSASKLAQDELPDLDVTIRGAVSIARRVQDPMAELVKIEPQHIGVGQYQHDVNQVELRKSLSDVVEDCVNSVGVNINTASPALLAYVAGLTKRTAENIVHHRQEHGPFSSRKEIQEVKGIGPKSFEQSAGFLRIPESSNVLDRTAVHPESYGVATKLLDQDLDDLDKEALARDFEIGAMTLEDIIQELKKPGRDPREDMPPVVLKSDILTIDDLEEGMSLRGTVRNVVDFGAFIDIGLDNDALCHISELSDSFVKHPSEIVQVSDVVDVRVLAIDKERNRVNLTMKS